MLKIIQTQDGSNTLFSENLNETYHSKFGAYTEAMHVYIKNGLYAALEKFDESLNILEVSFGTGLHSYLTLCESHTQKRKIHLTTVEYNPPPEDLVTQLGYEKFGGEGIHHLFEKLIKAPWNETTVVSDYFTITKLKQDVQQFTADEKYHLVYYSGFSYDSTPLVWEKQVLQNIYNSMLPNAVLVSHVAKGVFKRTLKEIGFSVEAFEGATGKREATRAIQTSLQ